MHDNQHQSTCSISWIRNGVIIRNAQLRMMIFDKSMVVIGEMVWNGVIDGGMPTANPRERVTRRQSTTALPTAMRGAQYSRQGTLWTEIQRWPA